MNIRKIRRSLDMTQVELAEAVGVSQRAVSAWERGFSHPRVPDLPKVAKVLGVTIDELLREEE